jgi:methionyl-tRNA formyltransferase
MRELVGALAISMCQDFVDNYPQVVQSATQQTGESTYYSRRIPSDSRLDPEKTITEQFNLLRVVDNERYPAFFELYGRRYLLTIEACDE